MLSTRLTETVSVITKGASAEVQITLRSASMSGPAARAQPIPLEPFSVNKEMGRVLIRRGGETIAAGMFNTTYDLVRQLTVIRRNRYPGQLIPSHCCGVPDPYIRRMEKKCNSVLQDVAFSRNVMTTSYALDAVVYLQRFCEAKI